MKTADLSQVDFNSNQSFTDEIHNAMYVFPSDSLEADLHRKKSPIQNGKLPAFEKGPNIKIRIRHQNFRA